MKNTSQSLGNRRHLSVTFQHDLYEDQFEKPTLELDNTYNTEVHMHSVNKIAHSDSRFVNIQGSSKTKSSSMWCCISGNDETEEEDSTKFNKIILKDYDDQFVNINTNNNHNHSHNHNDCHKQESDKIFAITCIDYRCHGVIRSYIENMGHKDNHDLISMAGADLCLTHGDCPEAWTQTLQDNLKIGVTLHDIKEIWVFAHQDCGACKKFGIVTDQMSKKEERDIHRKMSETSRNVLENMFPHVKVRHLYICDIDEAGSFDKVMN